MKSRREFCESGTGSIRRSPRGRHSLKSFKVGLFVVLSAISVQAARAGDRNMVLKLFHDTDLTGRVQPNPPNIRGIERERFVTVDMEPFVERPDSITSVILNFFPDVHLIAVKEKVQRKEDSIEWRGRIQGAPKSNVTVSVYPKQKLFMCNTLIKYRNPGFEPAWYQADNDLQLPAHPELVTVSKKL